MKPPYPSLTAEWHNNTYDAILPTNPSLSAKGKTVVITGGGSGIGQETAKAYAEAGAAHVAILARTQQKLAETKKIINAQSPDTKVTMHVADVADEESVRKTAAEVGGWDVLILNAGIMPTPVTIEKTSIAEWWRVYEVRDTFIFSTQSIFPLSLQPPWLNIHLATILIMSSLQTNVKGIIVTAQAFLPSRKASASIIGINAGMIQVPVGAGPSAGTSAYTSSKLAQVKIVEFLAAENPDVFAASVHPGVVVTDLMKTGMPQMGKEASEARGNSHFDDGELIYSDLLLNVVVFPSFRHFIHLSH